MLISLTAVIIYMIYDAYMAYWYVTNHNVVNLNVYNFY